MLVEGDLLDDGFAVIRGLANRDTQRELASALEHPSQAGSVRRGELFAMRNLLSLPAIRSFAASAPVQRHVTSILGPAAFPVRGILFNKTPQANWKVAWHQDLMIPVRARREAPGFGPWSRKAGVLHVLPPPEVLARMVTIRLHLDECGEKDGPLRLLRGSHAVGRLSDQDIDQWRQQRAVVPYLAAGDALLMRPLLLHASSPSESGKPRRVVHLEFASQGLPAGLEWADETNAISDAVDQLTEA